jgi:hypothetical protein
VTALSFGSDSSVVSLPTLKALWRESPGPMAGSLMLNIAATRWTNSAFMTFVAGNESLLFPWSKIALVCWVKIVQSLTFLIFSFP